MRDIYLIDFENVSSEGLSGITYLAEDDQVIIFYSNNSNRLTMKMHILIGKSICKLSYFEVTVGGKNALDHQIATWLGYLIGTGGAERNYYIVSRDMGYKHVANFWAANGDGPKVRCIDSIKAAGRLERRNKETKEPLLQAVPAEAVPQMTEEEPGEGISGEASELQSVEAVIQEIVTEAPTEPQAAAAAETEEAKSPGSVEAAEPVEEPRAETLEAEPVRKNYRNRTRDRRVRSKNPSREKQEQKHVEPVAETVSEPEAVAAAAVEETLKTGKKQSAKGQKSKEKIMEAKPSAGFDQLAVMIAPYPKLQESVLQELIANNKRQILCNTLRKHLGQEKGLALYNEIKRAAWH